MRRGFTADYPQCRSPSLERTIRAQCRSTQVSFTCCVDKYVLQWMGDDAFDVPCFHLQGTEQRGIRRTDDTRVDGCRSGLSESWDFSPIFRIVREYPRTKIRAESSSNGSKVAEWRFHSAQNPS